MPHMPNNFLSVKTGHSLIKASRGFGSLIEVIGYEGFKWVPRSFFSKICYHTKLNHFSKTIGPFHRTRD